jgi:hypothetical protein
MFTSYEVICDHLNGRSATDKLMLFTPDPYQSEDVEDLWNSELDERRETDESVTESQNAAYWVGAWIRDEF